MALPTPDPSVGGVFRPSEDYTVSGQWWFRNRTSIPDLRTGADVRLYGARGSGNDDTTAFQDALASVAGTRATVTVPPGTYRISTLTIPSYVTIRGSGWNSTILRALDANAPVFDVSRANDLSTGYLCGIESMRIVGPSTGTGSAIYASNANAGTHGLRVRDVFIANFGGAGVSFDAIWTSTLEHVQITGCKSHQFYIDDATNTVELRSCYARAIPTSGTAGFRVNRGQITLINCNGVDSGETWGVFGSEVAAGDAVDEHCRAVFIGCNIEDFSSIGISARRAARLEIHGCAFVAPAAGTNLQALYVANTNQTYPVIWGPSNNIATKGATWKNSYPIHMKLGPNIIVFGDTNNLATSVYNDLGGGGVVSPGLHGIDSANGTALRGGVFIGSTGSRITRALSGTASWAPNIANGAVGSATVPVTGAVVGDVVAVGYSGVVPAGVLISGGVSAVDTVTVTARNDSGGAWNPGTNTLRADVWQH